MIATGGLTGNVDRFSQRFVAVVAMVGFRSHEAPCPVSRCFTGIARHPPSPCVRPPSAVACQGIAVDVPHNRSGNE